MKIDYHDNHRLLFGTVFVGFLALSSVVSIWPAIWVQKHNQPLPDAPSMTAEEHAGLKVYVAEGCAYCHTQQVRPLPVDEAFGRASVPADYASLEPLDLWRGTPQLMGTERTGPDLSNVGQRQPSETWHYLHLYNPRSVVAASIMPSYPWLFDVVESDEPPEDAVPLPEEFAPEKGSVVPNEQGRALVAYLKFLVQPPLPTAESLAVDTEVSEEEPAVEAAVEVDGANVYASRCAACHQPAGAGLPGVFPPLVGSSVVNDADPTAHIMVVLNGSGQMPPWRDTLSDAEVAAVVNHERSSWGNTGALVDVAAVAKAREVTP